MRYAFPFYERIPHYYGDLVRSLFIATAAIMFVSIPFTGHLIPFGTLFEVVSGLVLITLAGLMNPHGTWVMVLAVIASGFGAFLFEVSAISFRMHDSFAMLVWREVGAILLATALYFSIKTVRAMHLGKIGQLPPPWEFEKGAENID